MTWFSIVCTILIFHWVGINGNLQFIGLEKKYFGTDYSNSDYLEYFLKKIYIWTYTVLYSNYSVCMMQQL